MNLQLIVSELKQKPDILTHAGNIYDTMNSIVEIKTAEDIDTLNSIMLRQVNFYNEMFKSSMNFVKLEPRVKIARSFVEEDSNSQDFV